MYVGVIDSIMVIKCIVYDLEKLRNMEVGSIIMFMIIFVKLNNFIIIISKLRVCKIGFVSVLVEYDRIVLELVVLFIFLEFLFIDVEKLYVKIMMFIRG